MKIKMKNNVVLVSLSAVVLTVLTATVLFSTTSYSKGDEQDSITLSKNNTLVLNSEVDGESVSSLISNARKMDEEMSSGTGRLGAKKPIYLFLYTPGGSIQAGLELIEALKGINRPVNTVTLFAASMGFQIAEALNDRLILKNGVLMSHHASGQFEGSFGGVHPSQLDSRYQLWLDRVRELDEQVVARTKGKQTYESYIAQYDHEMWLGGNKSVAQGYADKVVSVRCDSTLDGVTTKEASFMGLKILYDLDVCPINTAPQNVCISSENKNLNSELVKEVKARFTSQFENSHKNPIPMIW